MEKPIQIAGSGPSGLATAITLAQAGYPVVVYESAHVVGHRHQNDFQGLENWTTEEDVLFVLKEWGINIDSPIQSYNKGTAFDAWGKAYEVKIKNNSPLFYLVKRGSDPDTLDSSLLRQAISLGVDVRFNSPLKRLDGRGILATGPKAADAISVGYHFRTEMEDGFWVILDDNLAPKGYAYLLISNKCGVVKSCMFSDFKNERSYVHKTVETFQNHVGLTMINPTFQGGVGNFYIPINVHRDPHPLVGERAGFQDILFGFGIRMAIHSGILAANSIIMKNDDTRLCNINLISQMECGIVNRALYNIIGNKGYRWVLQQWTRPHIDIRSKLLQMYKPSFIKRCLLPWAITRVKLKRSD